MGAKRVLVTGGGGFVGGEIIRALNAKHPDFELSVLDIQPLAAELLQKADVRFFHADITDAEAVLKAVQAAKPDVVVHSAGIVPTRNARYSQKSRGLAFKVNVDGTKHVLSAAKQCGVKYFVYTSSITVITDDVDNDYPNVDERTPVGKATLTYGASKGVAEQIVLEANSPDFLTCAIRPSTLCGIGDYQLVPTIHGCIDKWETPWVIGDGTNLFDFSFVTNVAEAHVLAIDNLLGPATAAGEAFFISNGEPIPFRAFCLAIWAHFDHYPPFQVKIPKRLAWFAGLMAECATWFTGGYTTLSRGSVKDACQCGYTNIDKARRILGYNPRISLVDGLRVACEDYKRRLQNGEPVPRP